MRFSPVRARRSIGLDVGSAVLKLAVVDHAGDEPRLHSVTMRALSVPDTEDAEPADADVVSEALRDLRRRSGIGPGNLVISVGGRNVILKAFRMDRMSVGDARRVIRWEAEPHVPFGLDEVEIDFQITDPGGTNPRMDVLLVAAKRELVEEKMALVRKAGLRPDVVDVDATALVNALGFNYPEAMVGTAGLATIGHGSTSLALVEDGVPVLAREVAFGMRRITRELRRESGLGAREAGAVLRGEVDETGLGRFVADRATEIARGIERAAAFLETRRVGTRLGQLYLCGGGVHVPGLVDAIADRLGVETHVASPLRYLSVKPGALAPGEVERAAPLLMLALGLALRRPA